MSPSSFTTPLVISPLDDGRRWRLEEDFVYRVGSSDGPEIVVPAGTVTDFASVPRGLWNIFPPWGRYGKAAVLHDHLYATQQGSRAEADRIFKEAMKVLGVAWWKRNLIYWGVRAGGWLAWNGHKKRLAAGGNR